MLFRSLFLRALIASASASALASAASCASNSDDASAAHDSSPAAPSAASLGWHPIEAGGGGTPCSLRTRCPSGLLCVEDVTGRGKCQLPGELSPCEPSVGCQSGATCRALGGTNACARDCAQTSECPNALTSCQKFGALSICFWTSCNADGGAYGPCASDGVPGTCAPFTSGDVCLAAGSAARGQPCSSTRGDGGALCAPGETCIEDPMTGGSACLPICASPAGDGGPQCADGETCWRFNPLAEWGSCFASCGDAGTSCAPGTTCQYITATLSLCFP